MWLGCARGGRLSFPDVARKRAKRVGGTVRAIWLRRPPRSLGLRRRYHAKESRAMSHIQMPSLTAMIRAALALVAFLCPLSCHPPDELPSEQAVERIQQAIVLPSGFDRTTVVNDGPTVP